MASPLLLGERLLEPARRQLLLVHGQHQPGCHGAQREQRQQPGRERDIAVAGVEHGDTGRGERSCQQQRQCAVAPQAGRGRRLAVSHRGQPGQDEQHRLGLPAQVHPAARDVLVQDGRPGEDDVGRRANHDRDGDHADAQRHLPELPYPSTPTTTMLTTPSSG
jgi:hypothetical protein